MCDKFKVMHFVSRKLQGRFYHIALFQVPGASALVDLVPQNEDLFLECMLFSLEKSSIFAKNGSKMTNVLSENWNAL